MNKIISSIILTLLLSTGVSHAQTADSFNLAGIIENIINFQSKNDFVSDIRSNSSENFLYATKNFYNGNVVVAYNEYLNTINSLDKNLALLTLSKKLYEIGFFSLGDISLSRISGRNKMKAQIEELKETYRPSFGLTNDEENYLAKIYVSIYCNNSPEEAAFNLIKKTALLENSDYANFIMAESMFECKQYNQALIYVNKALDKNPVNSNYKLYKARIFFAMKKYKEAIKYIEEIENNISIFLAYDLDILKQQVKEKLSTDENDKKFYQLYTYYLSGNFYKTLKETSNILNFYKNNYKILTLQGITHISMGEINLAKEDLERSYKLNKKFELTLMGLGDINFIEKNYKEAYSYYKKLINSQYKKEAILKAELCLQKDDADSKKLAKITKLKGNIEENSYMEFSKIANDLFYDDEQNKKKYIAKSLGINFLNKFAWNVLSEIDYQNNNFDNIEKNIFLLSFSDNFDAQYYYFSALTLNNKQQKKEAFFEVKKALNIDPDFKPAIDLLNKLESDLI